MDKIQKNTIWNGEKGGKVWIIYPINLTCHHSKHDFLTLTYIFTLSKSRIFTVEYQLVSRTSFHEQYSSSQPDKKITPAPSFMVSRSTLVVWKKSSLFLAVDIEKNPKIFGFVIYIYIYWIYIPPTQDAGSSPPGWHETFWSATGNPKPLNFWICHC